MYSPNSKRYFVKMKSPDGIEREIVISSKSLLESFSVDAKKIFYELRIDDIKSFNEVQKTIGIRETNIEQSLYTSEIQSVDIWFENADNLMFFINKYARYRNALLGTRLNIEVSLAKSTDFNGETIDYPIDRYKFDFERMEPRVRTTQNLLKFKHIFYDYLQAIKPDWKTIKYSHDIGENCANKLMELGFLDHEYQVTNKFFDDFTSDAYNDTEKNYKQSVQETARKLQAKKMLMRDKTILAKLLFNIGIEKGFINSSTNELTDKALEYIKQNKIL